MNEAIIFSLIFGTFRMALPLMLAALGGIFSERTGVVNIALEGMMLSGAFFSVVGAYFTKNPWLGLLIGLISSLVFGILHAFATVKWKANHIISGIAINMLASGITVFLCQVFFKVRGTSPSVNKLPEFFFFLITAIIFIIAYIYLYKTPWGLRLRACGEHKKACISVGISVEMYQFIGVAISSLLAGLAGIYLSLGQIGLFREGMSAGRGFIALAAMIFGGWHPVKTLFACLLFGMAQMVQLLFTNVIPAQFAEMFPYIITIIVLAGIIGKTSPPAEVGLTE